MTNPFRNSRTIADLAAKIEGDLKTAHQKSQNILQAVAPDRQKPLDVLNDEPVLKGKHSLGVEDFKVEIVSDGTETTVNIVNPGGETVGVGVARRRRGDRRRDEVGVALAGARAFAEASKYYTRHAEELLS